MMDESLKHHIYTSSNTDMTQMSESNGVRQYVTPWLLTETII